MGLDVASSEPSCSVAPGHGPVKHAASKHNVQVLGSSSVGVACSLTQHSFGTPVCVCSLLL